MLRIITDNESLQGLSESWKSLTSEPLLSFAWHKNWWDNFSGKSELRIYTLEKNGEVVGIAPLFTDVWIGQKRLRLLGSGKACTDYGQFICKPEFRAEFAAAVANEISDSGDIKMLEFEGVSGSGDVQEIFQELDRTHWRYDKRIDNTWILELPETWDQFIAGSKKSLRRKIKKASQRIEKGQAEISSTRDELDFETAFDVLVRLHQQRFVSKGEPGVFADPRFTKFIFDSAKALCETDRAEIIVGKMEGKEIASQFYLLGDRGPQLYQAGICPGSMKFEPGHLMFTYATRKAVENGSPQFDFLRGDESYKPYWGAVQQPLLKVRYVSKQLAPTAVNQTYRAMRSVKLNLSTIWPSSTPASM